ncbi:MAG: hypothetical protein ACPG4X_16495 [Pikeienuella sp.]
MKMVLLSAVPKPASFANTKFSQGEWEDAFKVGEKEVPYITAKEAVINSKGLYRMKVPDDELATAPELPDPSDMTNSQLLAEMTMYGKAPRKQMNRSDVVVFVRKLRAEAETLIVDDDSGS